MVAIFSNWPTQSTGFSVSQPIFHLESGSRCLHIHFAETMIPLRLIANAFQPQLVSVTAIFQSDRLKMHVFQYLKLGPIETENG